MNILMTNQYLHYYESDRDSVLENYIINPEGLNLIEQDQIEPLVNRNSSSDSDLDHYLLDPDGIYLEN